MSRTTFSIKRKELKSYVAQLKVIMADASAEISEKARRLIDKIKALINELRFMMSGRELSRILGATAIFFGIGAGQEVYAQTFAPPLTTPFGLSATSYWAIPQFVDLDNDGDYDLSVAELDTITYYASIRYFENTGTNTAPQYAAPTKNPFGIDLTATSAYFAMHTYADIDGDGDQDLFVGGSYYGTFLFKNNGTATNPSFTSVPIQNPYGLDSIYYATPVLVDLDNDGDLDFLSNEYYDGIVYYENTGTATVPQFGPRQVKPFGITATAGYNMLSVGDVDGDGDQDIMHGDYGGDIKYLQNTGSASAPAFAAPVSNPSNITPGYIISFPTMADLDGDGDVDLLTGEVYGAMYYFENLLPHASIGEERFELSVFPNVVSDNLHISTNEHLSKIEIIDMRGITVRVYDPAERNLSVDGLAAGQYLVKAVGSGESQVLRKVTVQ